MKTKTNMRLRVSVGQLATAAFLMALAFLADAASAQQVVAINSGGAAVSPFVADTDFAGGSTINHANTIDLSGVTSPAPMAAYQSARIGNFTYTIPGFAAGSSNTVRLHFAETFWSTAGSRIFNVSINGTQVLANFDVFAAAGAQNKAVVRQFTANANASGQYVITFTSVKDNSLVSAVEIDSASSSGGGGGGGTSAAVQINSAGPAVSPFAADTDFAGGSTINHANTINLSGVTNPAPAAVYQTARVGNFTYTIPGFAAGSSNTVRLHFAETFWTAAGSRIFNVSINGTQVLANFDVFAAAGAQNKAVIKEFTANANSSGQYVITFTSVKDNSLLSAIEIGSGSSSGGGGGSCSASPSAPTGLGASGTTSSGTTLSWSAVTPPASCSITGYTIFENGSAVATSTSTSFTVSGLAASTTYTFGVAASDSFGMSAQSSGITVTTASSGGGGGGGPVAPPTSLTAVGSSDQQIDLRWVASTTPAPNTAPVNYRIYRDTISNFTPSASNQIGTTIGITNFIDTNYRATISPATGPGVVPGATYFYQVVASTPAGTSTAASASATALPSTPSTGAPAELTGLTAMAQNANEVDLMWNSTTSGVGTAVTTYNIYRSTSPTFTPSASNRVGSTKSNWFQDVLCAASTQYFYQVLASNSLGTSPASATVTASTPALNPQLWGGAPFFDASGLPAKNNVVMLKFLNRTNGKFSDSQITWSATIGGATTTNTLAQANHFDMPANSAGRMYFYLNDPSLALNNTNYWDFIEFTVGPNSINVDTTRVDALGVKLALNLTCTGTNIAVGENEQTFQEDRSVTFQRYVNDTPSTLGGNFNEDLKFQPFRIIEPGGAGFNSGGDNQNYYANYISGIWSFNGLTIAEAGPNGSGLGSFPDLSAAIFRHTAPTSGTREFASSGSLTNQGMWGNPASFYQLEPYNHYAQWIEAQAINMQQYAFPYNDAGGYSSDISCSSPQTMLVAIGW